MLEDKGAVSPPWIFRDNILKAQEEASLKCREWSRAHKRSAWMKRDPPDLGGQTAEGSAGRLEGTRLPRRQTDTWPGGAGVEPAEPKLSGGWKWPCMGRAPRRASLNVLSAQGRQLRETWCQCPVGQGTE